MSLKDATSAQEVSVSERPGSAGPFKAPRLQSVSSVSPPSDAELPLSFAQQRLWFLDQLHPQSPTYNIPVVVRLRGNLRVDALEEAIVAVVDRHHVLRTRFSSVAGQPCQKVHEVGITLEIKDLSGGDERAVETDLRQRLREEARRPFDLSRDALLRAILFRLKDNEHALFVNMHHIASDSFSFGLFFRELGQLYQALIDGRPAALPELPIQYVDYAVWQRKVSDPAHLLPHLEYWRQKLAGASHLLELPTDYPRPPALSFRGDKCLRRLSPGLVVALQQLSRREEVTPFMLLLTAFKALLFRLTHQEDILVGAPITGRERAGTERLIGFFSNTLALRSQPEGTLTFRDLLQQVRATTLEAYSHQLLPFERLVEELRLDRATNHNPLVQIMFELQPAWARDLALPGLEATLEVLDTGTSKFDLTLVVTTSPDTWVAEMEFNSDLFDGSTIERWLGHFETLLTGVSANPELRLSALPLLSQPERQRLLTGWNSTQRDLPTNQGIHELFEEQARQRPDGIALALGERQLTYGQVNARANQLAHRLRALGVGPECLVGICAERSLKTVIAILAVLKAGGAYLPMDPSYPAEHLRFMLRDAQVPLLLTDEKFADRFSFTSEPAERTTVLCLDTLDVSEEPVTNLSPTGAPENLAYVIYTSGSTGKPKGVEITNRCLLNHCLSIARIYELSPEDRVLQFAALSFDVSVEEIFPSLLSGCVVVMRPEEALASIQEFLRFVERERISVLNLPTAFWHTMVDVFSRTAMPRCIRLLVVGGERASSRHFQTWKEYVGETIKFINAYGLTETTITSTVYVSTPDGRQDLVPIGRPIDNTQAFILDDALEPVPVGVVGELFIGGHGVARGYLNRPELTAQRFLTKTLAAGPIRLYKTGDLARFLSDGNIEFIGRRDHQVKIRGFRVELGEIETQLRQCPKVRDAVVKAFHNGGEKALVAYVVAADPALAIPELSDNLKKRLPHYMLPSAFILLEAMPVTANGKVDRNALPEPAFAMSEHGCESDGAPRNQIERELAEIWCELLGLPAVGIHDNYFRLGGHSLLALRMVWKIRESFLITLSTSSIFQAPTIAELAPLIEAQVIRESAELAGVDATVPANA